MFWCMFLLLALVAHPMDCRHIDRKFEKDIPNEEMIDAAQEDPNPNVRRQLQRPHLRIHLRPPKVLHVREGADEFLECQAGGSPAPDVHWLKDGRRINQASDEHPKPESKPGLAVSFTASRLYLDCLSAEDVAEYTCVAENPFQRTSTTTRVSLMDEAGDEVLCIKDANSQPPRIHTWTKTMIASQGQSTRLRCRAAGHPRPTVRWLGVKHEELSSADLEKYQVLSSGDLLIHDLKWSDMGNYVCVAENVHGEARVEAFLYPAVPDP